MEEGDLMVDEGGTSVVIGGKEDGGSRIGVRPRLEEEESSACR